MKMLNVRWSENESCSYYVDKDRFSKAHDRKNEVILNSFSGTYHFIKDSKEVVLDTGVEIRKVNCVSWELEERDGE